MSRKREIGNQLRRERRQFTEPIGTKQAHKIARSESGTEFSPVIRSIAAEKRGSVKRQKQIGSAYAGLTAEIAANAQKASEGNAATNAAITQRLQQAGLQSQSSLNNLAAQDSATAKLLGGPSNAVGSAQMAAGNSQRASQLAALTAPNTAAGASYANYLRQRGTSSRERGIEATSGEAARRAKIKEDLRAAKKQRGQATVANLQKLRGEERDYKIQNRAFPLEKQKAGLEASEAAEENRRKNEAQRNENTKTRNENKRGGLTPSEQHTRRKERKEAQADRRGALNEARALLQSEAPPKSAKEWAKFQAALAAKSEISPQLAAWAVKKLRPQVERRRRKREAAQNAAGAIPGL